MVFRTGLLLTLGCSNLGKAPSEEERQRFTHSQQFDKASQKFVNRQQEMMDKILDETDIWSTTWEFLFGGEEHRLPSKKLPEVSVDVNKVLSSSHGLSFVWLGHSNC